MRDGVQLAEVAALVGDPARAHILAALLDGRALTAGELAYAASVSPQTASGHLAKLAEGRLVEVARQGRHRYYRLAGAAVAQMLESIMAVAADSPPRYRPASKVDAAMRTARTCYDHLAGRLGVGLADALTARGHVVLGEDGGEVTEAGAAFLAELGVALAGPKRTRRPLCRACPDWTERRPHLAGRVGAALAARCFDLGWIERRRDSRALTITRAGEQGFAELFDLHL
ncbi:MAG: winged helix-turn-helix transcriptional regulator [Rhodospirillales bacterium]|nr:winged helix-turn-helix transcriptional regulator [Rhodospirillales bacterium]